MSVDPKPMQAAWVLTTDPVDYAKARTLGLRRIYLDIRYATRGKLDNAHSFGFEAGVYWGANWGEIESGPEANAILISNAVGGFGNTQCAVMVDFEAHDPAFVLAWLKAWRALRPLKWTSWTLESFQGGWFTPELVTAIRADDNLVVVPQLYKGDMTPADGLAATKDLVAAGVDPWRIQGFYSGAALPFGWTGCIFTLESAPTVAP